MTALPHTAAPAPAAAGLTLNGTPLADAAGLTLAELLAREPQTRELAPEAYATAVNGEFVPRGQRAARRLAAGDAVTLFQAIVGG